MQGDLSDNGPNPGDRLIDWNGVYNLWSHCNAAYGGFNDVRLPAPAVQDFLLQVGHGQRRRATGRGRRTGRRGDAGDLGVRRAGAGLHRRHARPTGGSAYPTTPGHFDDANACAGY